MNKEVKKFNAYGTWSVTTEGDCEGKSTKNYPISINGKLITNMEILSNSENEVKGFVLSNETVKHHLQGLDIVKVIVFMGKLVNIVTKIK